jgi:hypothetical protein
LKQFLLELEQDVSAPLEFAGTGGKGTLKLLMCLGAIFGKRCVTMTAGV